MIARSELIHDPITGKEYGNDVFLVNDLLEFLYLLQEPENHIKVPSGQYVERPVHIRQVHDMTDERAQELTKLPRFQTYTKIIKR